MRLPASHYFHKIALTPTLTPSDRSETEPFKAPGPEEIPHHHCWILFRSGLSEFTFPNLLYTLTLLYSRPSSTFDGSSPIGPETSETREKRGNGHPLQYGFARAKFID
ncbi:hypothetical protein CROQUDRAFT_99672 [Cronartium quercuum f. sp. fusiforme G11]|uniref:Uncharacterized protein n=1 Tax=Cronartium quercuum f. sp. fusiforme G11 TaxID=708437 RepID=A0A9P6T692_9BASI|nr:hypothetical protein CROQUDRAFT_99672 [Cronartium quercuum f. sp. fusiforme G11]